MNKILFLFCACSLQILSAEAQRSDPTPFLQKSFSREQVRQLTAETSGGNIVVTGQASGEARVEVMIDANGRDGHLSKEEIQKRLDEQFDLDISLTGNTLKAIAKRKDKHFNDWNRSLSISFWIFVPQNVSSSLRTSGGNIGLSDLNGKEDFSTSGGNINVSHLSGKVLGRTSGGNVTISDSKDDIDLMTSGGNMDAKHCEGTIRLSTSGGNVSVHDVKGDITGTTSGGSIDGAGITGEFRTRTSGGDIHLEDLSCSLAASTSGGNIHINMKTTGKYIDLSNSGGDINLTLPQGQGLTLNVHGDNVRRAGILTNFSGTVDQRHIDGTLNGGGIPVKISGNSDVSLSFK